MVLDRVDEYYGQHSVTFTVDGETKNTWDDWGLVPSSRHSEPVNGVWKKDVTIPGVHGQEDLVRINPYSAANNYFKLRKALVQDNRNQILSDYGYDIYQPTSGNLGFVIADQTKSFFQKQQEITAFLHGKMARMTFADDPSRTYTVRTTVEGFSSAEKYSTLSIGYSVISET